MQQSRTRTLLILCVLLVVVFLLSGGLGAVHSYLFGAESFGEYRYSTVAPFFGGFILVGAFGLMFAYKHRDSRVCLLGFLISIFCYCGIEVFVNMLGVV